MSLQAVSTIEFVSNELSFFAQSVIYFYKTLYQLERVCVEILS